jgi:hypothetical protein
MSKKRKQSKKCLTLSELKAIEAKLNQELG